MPSSLKRPIEHVCKSDTLSAMPSAHQHKRQLCDITLPGFLENVNCIRVNHFTPLNNIILNPGQGKSTHESASFIDWGEPVNKASAMPPRPVI